MNNIIDKLKQDDRFKINEIEKQEMIGVTVFYNNEVIFQFNRVICPRENRHTVKELMNGKLLEQLNKLNINL